MAVTRILDLLVAAVLLYSALVQGNDADPAYWVLLYGSASTLALASALNRRYPKAALIVLGAALAGVVQSASGFLRYLQSGELGSIVASMSAAKPWIEPARECLGALMVLGVVAYIHARYKKL